jgi:prevent-host-death family protein
MKTVQIREAKAKFSALVETASKGEPVMITRHGEAVAALIPIEDAVRLYPAPKVSLVDYLMSMPGELESPRDPSPMRDVEL